MHIDKKAQGESKPAVQESPAISAAGPNRNVEPPLNTDQRARQYSWKWRRISAYIAVTAIVVALVFLAGSTAHSWLIPARGTPSAEAFSADAPAMAGQPLPQIPRPSVNSNIARTVAPRTEADDFRLDVIT